MASSFSFYATKNLTTGEGGMVITNNKELAEKIKILRLHGMDKDAFARYAEKGKWYYEIEEAGYKYNLTDVAAAIGLVQLKNLTKNNQLRREAAEEYRKHLSGVEGIVLPQTLPERENVWHLFPILVEAAKRDRLVEQLQAYNIGVSVHFIPLHMMPYYQRNFKYKVGDLSISEQTFAREISLPLHPNISKEEITYICQVLIYFLENE